ncbi:MAG: hypothetical protein PHD01_13935 [Geobacteraceae bacterium]|nr:hypothetical protein [Geobacteraceae bacterium]
MAGPKKIAVLTQSKEEFESKNYFLALLVERWKETGIEVVILHGSEHYVPADALILHVDLTVIPEAFSSLASRYPVVINGLVTDISKRRVSSNILGPKDPHAGPVIVKTNLNAGGTPERLVEWSNPWRRLTGKILRKLPWALTGILNPYAYPIFPDIRSVPRLAWRNSKLVVEKYRPEREGDFFCVRHWLFLGNQEFSYRALSYDPIVKAENTVHRERGIPVPESLRSLRTKLSFDYGKFDYAVVDGEVILYDANRTPTIAPNALNRGKVLAQELADGLNPFF